MNDGRNILTLQLLSFLIFTAGYGSKQLTSSQIGNTSAVLPPPPQLLAWAGMTFLFLVLADFGEGPAELAQAFAFLIFVSVLLLYGYDVFTKLTGKFQSDSSKGPVKPSKGSSVA